VERIVERIRDGIVPDDSAGEPPLLPLLNRYQGDRHDRRGELQDDAAGPRDRA
jgi:hypothetical protein